MENKAEQAPLLLETLPGIDIKTGVRLVGGREALYRKLLLRCADDHACFEAQITALRQAEKKDDLRMKAHGLRGVAGSLGASLLQSRAEILEHLSKDNAPWEEIDTAIGLLFNALNEVLAGIKAGISPEKTETPPAQTMGFPELKAELSRVQKLIEQFDTEAQDRLEVIVKKISAPELRTELNKIRTQIAQYDFDMATQLLKNCLANLKQ